MLNIYYCDITSFPNLIGSELLPQDRQAKLIQYKQFPDQVRCLVSGLLLRHALGPELSDSIIVDDNGKPHVADSSIHFNLSHSGSYVILGVSNHTIGVDIEKNASYRSSVACKCFTSEEQAWLSSTEAQEKCSDTDQNTNQITSQISDAFFKIWTGKEGIIKAIGQGFRLAPESFQVLPITNSFHKILDSSWYMQWTSIDAHTVCVVTSHEEDMTLIELTREQLIS